MTEPTHGADSAERRPVFVAAQGEADMIRRVLGEYADGLEFQIRTRPSWWREGRPDLTLVPGAGDPSYSIPDGRYRIPEVDSA